jgi:hypothetical protein
MRPAAFPFALMLTSVGQLAAAQTADDALSQLKACAQKDDAERLECFDRLSRRTAEPKATGSITADYWTIAETTSPVDYSPLVVASTISLSTSDRAPSVLTISCRGGRTEVAVTRRDVSHPGQYVGSVTVAYQINSQPAIEQRWAAAKVGNGVAYSGDTVRFLRSLPDEGEFHIRVLDGRRILQEASFLLRGLDLVRDKMASACKWPSTGGAQRH